MLASQINLPRKAKVPLYMVLCGLYGLSFGILYAPFQMFMMGWSLDMTIKWVVFGIITTDIVAAVNNFALGVLIIPLSELLKRLEKHSFS